MPYANREVLAGYPKEFTFESRSQLEQYFGGPRITCLLCGHSYRLLETHLRNVHLITGDDYREKYGIPYLQGLCGVTFSERRVELGKALWEENTERQAAALAKAKAVQAATGTNPQRDKPSFWKTERSGESNHNHKLTAAEARAIRERAKAGEDPKAIATQFGITKQNVQWIAKGRTWKTA